MKKIPLIILTLPMLLYACSANEDIPDITNETIYSVISTEVIENAGADLSETIKTTETTGITEITEITETTKATETTKTIETSTVTETQVTISAMTKLTNFEMPSQDYIGLWATDKEHYDEILISEISNNEIKFHMSIYRRFGTVNGIAKIENDKMIFNADDEVIGTMEFADNCILMTVTESNHYAVKVGEIWNFNFRD